MTQRKKIPTIKLFELWNKNVAIEDICKQLNLTKERLRKFVSYHKLPKRIIDRRCRDRTPDPTPEELAARMLEVRQKWSEREEEMRYNGPRKKEWTVPTYHFDSEAGTFEHE